MTPSASDLVAGAVVTMLFLGIVAAAEAWRRWRNPKPEWTRKLIHIAGGFVALTLPLVIDSHWVVLAMALGMALLFLAGKLTGRLRSLHGVSRKSSGTEYYPVVIYCLFLATQGAPWKYFICVLVLTTADALAALIGSRYGRLRYEVDQNFKSVEGSLVFLVVTFLAVFVPLMTWPLTERPTIAVCLLTALMVAMLTTAFEAVAQHGHDNLWVPLGTLIILNRVLTLPAHELAKRIVVLSAIAVLTSLATWRTVTFNVGGTLVLILAAYACWTLGSIDWARPVFLGLVFYVCAVFAPPPHIVIASKAVFKALIIPFLAMVGAYLLELNDVRNGPRFFYGPFLAGCVTVTAQTAWDEVLRNRQLGWAPKFFGSMITTWLACAVILLPTRLVHADVSAMAALWVAAAALAVGIPSGMLFDHQALANSDRLWWTARMLSITLAMALVIAAQAAGVSPLWNPR